MPRIDPGYNQPRKRPRPRSAPRPATPHNADTGDPARSRPAPSRAPRRPTRLTRPTPDQADRTEIARQIRLHPLAGDAPQTRAADTAKAEAYKRTSAYLARLQAARATRAHRIRQGILQGFQRETAAQAQAREDQNAIHQVRFHPALDQPRTNAELAHFLRTGQRPVRVGGQALAHQQQAVRLAPVLSVLDQTTRPIHAVAGATDAALHGRNVPHAALRGLQNKDRTTFSDVLEHAGLHNKVAKGVLGFGLDVALDPTTYLSGGLASPARAAALKAGARAEKRALAAGLTGEQAKRFGQRAAQHVLKGAPDARGVSVRLGGHDVPGVTRATARAGRTVHGGVERAAPLRGTRNAARHVAADFNPNVVPDGADRATYGAIREATRTARSTASREVYKVRQQAAAVNKAIGDKDYRTVLDAIENGRVGSLPAHLQKPGRFLRDRFKYARRIEKQAGIRGATRANYVPHLRQDLAEEGKGIGQQTVGSRKILPSSSRARKDTRSLAEIRRTDPGKYIEDPGVLYGARMTESAMSRSKAELNRRLGEIGRRVHQGRALDLRAGEAVYHVKGSDIRKLDLGKADDARELQRFVDGSGRKGGQYVALNQQAVDRALKRVNPSGERSAIGAGLDKAQGTWKLLATQPNPGFHVRNFLGDLQNAYLGQSAPRLARNLSHSARALTELGRQEKGLKTLSLVGSRIDPAGKGLKIGGQRMSYSQLIAEAEKTGGVRSGFVSRELHDLIEGRTARHANGRFSAIKRWANNREDVVRLATYIGARQRGMTAEKAAAHVATHHFDYSDLTELERRVMRRVMPFWTFSARNIPLQFKALVANPGKYAQYEKIREEVAKAFGYQDGWEGDLSDREQRSAPIGIRIGGKPYTISLGPSGLPLTDLNEFPTTKNPIRQADEWIDRAMSLLTPAVKTPVEMWANFSFFFRDQIEKPDAPLVPVSTLLVKAVPAKYRKQLGFTPDYVDKRTGKKQWAAPAKIVYAMGVLPGPASFLNRVTTPSERPGQSPTNKAVGYLGARGVQVDARTTQIDNLYKERAKVDKQMRALNQQGVSANAATPEYQKLQAKEKDLTGHIMALRTIRGDKILPGGRPATRLVGNGAGGLDPLDLREIRGAAQEAAKAIDKADLDEIRAAIRGGG